MLLLTENQNINQNAESVFSHRFIRDGEAVGIYLHKFYTSTEKLIAQLLTHNHKVTLKYKDTQYILTNIEEWRVRIQDPNDQIREITVKHPIKCIFDESKSEFIEKCKLKQAQAQYQSVLSTFTDVPTDEELTSLLSAFAPLYGLDIDYSNKITMLEAYRQIQYYLDNDIEYVNEVSGVPPEDTPFADMFATIQQPQSKGIEIISIGNLEMLDDLHEKCQHPTVLVDDIISSMI